MTNPPTEKNRNPTSGSASPDSQGRRVFRVSAQSAEDPVAREAVLAHLDSPGTSSATTTGSRVQHKQVHTHSVRDLCEGMSDDEEDKMTRPPSGSPIASSPDRSPSRSRSSSVQLLRCWVSDALPAVTLALALGAFLCAAITLSRPRAPPGGR
ncbi:hypothetical protein MRX96_009474 [Rhipicephalus microplus]